MYRLFLCSIFLVFSTFASKALIFSSFSYRCRIRDLLRHNGQLPDGIDTLRLPKRLQRYIDLMEELEEDVDRQKTITAANAKVVNDDVVAKEQTQLKLRMLRLKEQQLQGQQLPTLTESVNWRSSSSDSSCSNDQATLADFEEESAAGADKATWRV